jgi:LysR family transcriptional regulator, glycine cleavage system transcriptional activator
MNSLRTRLPPTNALVTFEAVARHLSFTQAARELGVSQAATSRQVRLLEDHLGVVLLDRARKRVRLTAAGQQLLEAVAMGFGHIASVGDGLRQERRARALTVATSLAFSAFWLMPRLPAFHAAYPALELRLSTSDSEADWHADDVDVAVVFGPQAASGWHREALFGDRVIAVCRPDYFGARRVPEAVSELQEESLLQIESPYISWFSWPDWFARNAVPLRRDPRGPRFNNYIIAIQAALDGQGLALGWRRLIAPLLDDGRLIQVTSASVTPEDDYVLLVPARADDDRRVRAFRRWILDQAKQDWN